MTTIAEELLTKAQAAKAATRELRRLGTEAKDRALHAIADALESQQAPVLAANSQDCAAGRQAGLSEAMLDRLLLTPERLHGMAADVRSVAAQPDPVGESFDERTLANGLKLGKRRVPLGVIGAVYESRPNVTVDIFVLCLKSGNAVVLRGGKEAINSNEALVGLIKNALVGAGVTTEAVQFVHFTDRAGVEQMVKLDQYIDLLIPRGGAELIRYVAREATMPVITGGIGVCHTYVDAAADLAMAREIVFNAKVQRPTVCNALDTVLVHSQAAPLFLPEMSGRSP